MVFSVFEICSQRRITLVLLFKQISKPEKNRLPQQVLSLSPLFCWISSLKDPPWQVRKLSLLLSPFFARRLLQIQQTDSCPMYPPPNPIITNPQTCPTSHTHGLATSIEVLAQCTSFLSNDLQTCPTSHTSGFPPFGLTSTSGFTLALNVRAQCTSR
jgi:hypothetical protein